MTRQPSFFDIENKRKELENKLGAEDYSNNMVEMASPSNMEVVCFRNQLHSCDYHSDNYWYYIPDLELVILEYSSTDFTRKEGGERDKGIKILQHKKGLEHAELVAMGCVPKRDNVQYSAIKFIDIGKKEISELIADIKLRDEIGLRIENRVNSLYHRDFS